MKKKICMILIAALIGTVLMSCGGSDRKETPEVTIPQTEATEQSSAPETTMPETTAMQTEAEETEAEVSENPEESMMILYETDRVLADNEYVFIELKSAEVVENVYNWEISVENRCNETIEVERDAWSVNGAYCNFLDRLLLDIYVVDPGEVESYPIEMIEDLDAYGIDQPSIVEGSFKYRSHDYSAGISGRSSFCYYPEGEAAAQIAVRESQSEDLVIVDTDEYAITATEFVPKQGGGVIMMLYIQNRTDRNLCVSTDDVTVNGSSRDPRWVEDVPAHMNAFSRMAWDSNPFGVIITDPHSVTGNVSGIMWVEDNKTWETLYKEPFSLDF